MDIPWEDLLLGDRQAGAVYPVALQLVDLPIIRAVQKLEAVEEGTSRLPVCAYRAELSGRRADGSSYKVVVKGDDHHGLPYGADGDIFLPCLKLPTSCPNRIERAFSAVGNFRIQLLE